MRILHTADWHFGKTIEGRDRLAEQQAFVEELCGICADERIDLVLVAGDVFQSPNPSAAAEELFYYAVDRLAEHGKRGLSLSPVTMIILTGSAPHRRWPAAWALRLLACRKKNLAPPIRELGGCTG